MMAGGEDVADRSGLYKNAPEAPHKNAPEAPLRLCVLLVTRGRPDWLARCLQSIEAGARECPSLALSVVAAVNGQDDASQTVLARHGAEVAPPAPAVSPAEARNRLLGRVAADWVFFIDDDAYVEPGFFARFLALRARFPEARAFGGPNLTPPGSPLFQRATGVALASRFATYLSRPRYRGDGTVHFAGEAELILCNLFVRRDALGAAPFPAAFVCAEENWLLQTLASQGFAAVYASDLSLRHERRPSFAALGHQVFRYGFGRGQNLRRRPSSLRWPHLVPGTCVLYALALPGLAYATGGGAVWLAPFALYAFALALASVRAAVVSDEGWGVFPVLLLIFPTIHLAYGLGSLAGLACGGGEKVGRHG